jgi:hypothetical protein
MNARRYLKQTIFGVKKMGMLKHINQLGRLILKIVIPLQPITYPAAK